MGKNSIGQTVSPICVMSHVIMDIMWKYLFCTQMPEPVMEKGHCGTFCLEQAAKRKLVGCGRQSNLDVNKFDWPFSLFCLGNLVAFLLFNCCVVSWNYFFVCTVGSLGSASLQVNSWRLDELYLFSFSFRYYCARGETEQVMLKSPHCPQRTKSSVNVVPCCFTSALLCHYFRLVCQDQGADSGPVPCAPWCSSLWWAGILLPRTDGQ